MGIIAEEIQGDNERWQAAFCWGFGYKERDKICIKHEHKQTKTEVKLDSFYHIVPDFFRFPYLCVLSLILFFYASLFRDRLKVLYASGEVF